MCTSLARFILAHSFLGGEHNGFRGNFYSLTRLYKQVYHSLLKHHQTPQVALKSGQRAFDRGMSANSAAAAHGTGRMKWAWDKYIAAADDGNEMAIRSTKRAVHAALDSGTALWEASNNRVRELEKELAEAKERLAKSEQIVRQLAEEGTRNREEMEKLVEASQTPSEEMKTKILQACFSELNDTANMQRLYQTSGNFVAMSNYTHLGVLENVAECFPDTMRMMCGIFGFDDGVSSIQPQSKLHHVASAVANLLAAVVPQFSWEYTSVLRCILHTSLPHSFPTFNAIWQ